MLEAWLVFSTFKKPSPPSSLSPMHKLTWAVQTAAWYVWLKFEKITATRCAALIISLVYWLAVHSSLVSRGFFKSTQDVLTLAVPGLLQLSSMRLATLEN